MTHLVTRGLGATVAQMVTEGLGPDDLGGGITFMKAVSGVIAMAGALTTLYIPASTASSNQGGVAIDIDTGV